MGAHQGDLEILRPRIQMLTRVQLGIYHAALKTMSKDIRLITPPIADAAARTKL